MAKILTDNGKILTTSDGRAIASVATDEFVPVPGKWYRHILTVQMQEFSAENSEGNVSTYAPEFTYEIINTNPTLTSINDFNTYFISRFIFGLAEVPAIFSTVPFKSVLYNLYLKSNKPLWLTIKNTSEKKDDTTIDVSYITIHYGTDNADLIEHTIRTTNPRNFSLASNITFEMVEPLN